ncbi:TPA: dephospho-CoA kinase, partial [Neisseria meningitidis]
AAYGIVEIPLLTEKRQFISLIRRVLTISAPVEKRIGRVMARSGLTRGEVAAVISHQASESERLLLADDVLLNDGSLKSLREKTMRLHAFYSGIFASKPTQGKHND